MKRRLLAILFLACAAMYSTSLTTAQERFGRLSGTVNDEQNTAVPGVTVTVTSTDSGAVRVFVTDATGKYNAQDLQPGRYNVAFELSGFSKVERNDITVVLGKSFQLDAQMRVGALTEVVQVTAAAPIVDTRSSVIAHNVSSEEFTQLPKGRSFQSIALTSPSVNSGEIEGGFQVNGASGAENAFTVDGVVTNSLVNGKSRQDTVFEYLQEVQVKTAGIDAEFGGALGGVVSAVTKSGGNVFRGEGHYFFDGSPLSAGPIQRLVLNPVDDKTVSFVQDEKQRNIRNEIGFSLGGPILKDRLFFFASVSPRFVRRTNDYGYSSNTEQGSVDQSQNLSQMFGKMTYSKGRVQANGSVLSTPTSVDGTILAYNGTAPNSTSVTASGNQPNIARGWEQKQINTSGSVDISVTNTSLLSMKTGYFYDKYTDLGISTETNYTYQTSSVGLPQVPVSLWAPLGTVNTPRAQITDFDTTKRAFFDVNYNQSFNGAGSHVLKAGYGIQHVTNIADSAYPGGYVDLFWGRTFTSSVPGVGTGTGAYGYYAVNDRGTVGEAGANINSLFVQDQWVLGSRLTLNLGLRTEHEVVPSFREGIAAMDFGFGDKLAPRLGATFDVKGDGRFKVYGSWGRYFDWTKYELPRGSYGGDIWHIFYRALDTTDIASLDLSNMPGRDLWDPSTPNSFRDRRVPNFDSTDPDIKPMSQDSTSVGAEFQVGRNSSLGVHYIHNDLRQTIEDLGGLVNGNEIYVIGNPGEGIGALTPTSGLTKPFATPKPVRTYDALELTFSRRFANNWFGSASYTYSRLYGNYAGLASSDEILTPTTGVSSATSQQQGGSISRQGGNANRAWDIDEILIDSKGGTPDGVLGNLATDRPSVVKLYGAYTFPFGTQVGANYYGGSGTPITTYVVTLNQTNAMVNGRGDMGRTPFLNRTDLLISHELSMPSNRRLRLELNMLNLFNQKTVLHYYNYLNRGGGAPRTSSSINLASTDLTKGYDYRALINATSDGAANAYDPRYGKADLWATGLQGQFSVKFLF